MSPAITEFDAVTTSVGQHGRQDDHSDEDLDEDSGANRSAGAMTVVVLAASNSA
jgi:hypothetical protein